MPENLRFESTAEAIEWASEDIRKMNPEEFRQHLREAGILGDDGNLTTPYGGESEQSIHCQPQFRAIPA